MALSVPTNITPSVSSGLGSGVVDVSDGITVTWQVNGASPMEAYRYVIMQNDTASTQVYDSGRVTLASPFYGRDFKGNVQFFSFTIPASDLTSMTNGYENGYKAIITQWWDEENSIAQPSASFFITRAAPSVEISAVPSPLSAKNYVFSANFSQEQGDTLDWFRWVLQDSEGNVLEDTQEIYGTGDIRMEYDGFFSGETYTVQCFIQTESGVQAASAPVSFVTEYSTTPITGFTSVCQKGEGLFVSFPDLSYIFGTATGSYTITNEVLSLTAGSSITWDTVTGKPMDHPAPWWVYYKGFPRAGVFLQVGDVEFSISGGVITAMHNGEIIGQAQTVYNTEHVLELIAGPTVMTLRTNTSIGGLAPALSLAPSEGLAPKRNDKIQVFSYTVPLSYTQGNMTGATLLGAQTVEFLWVSGAQMDLGDPPAFDANAYLAADFKSSLNAGNVTVYAGDVVGAAVYRQDNGSSFLQHICDLPLGELTFMDYGAPSQGSYVYYVFFIGENTYLTAPIVSQPFTPLFWNWTLLECEKDENGRYHVMDIFPFSLNVSTSEISNNNTPSVLENFTPYPKVQPSTANYASGTLQAYIGKVDRETWQYADSVSLAEKIWGLSLSTSALFLKDRKGNLWRVKPTAPTIMQVSDNTRQQLYRMTLQWTEIGEVDGSIVLTSADALWEVVV